MVSYIPGIQIICAQDLKNIMPVKFWQPRLPFRLMYYEAYLDEWDAREREIFFKSGGGRKYINTKLARTLLKAKI